jgi:ribosome-associated translation inhibitor RaiA
MQIQFNTDNNIEGYQQLEQDISGQLNKSLARFDEYITRLEVHISDENSHKSGQKDRRCLLEARLKKHQPLAVSNNAPTTQQALTGATDKLKRVLTDTIARLNDKNGSRPPV